MRTAFSSHIYLFNNRLFQQRKSGPIGLRLTGVAAWLAMANWARVFLKTLAENNTIMNLFKKYVDYVNLAMAITPPGMSCEREPNGDLRLVWTKEREEKDLEEETDVVSCRRRKMALVLEISNSLLPGITFTVDIPSNYINGMVPMLDTQV